MGLFSRKKPVHRVLADEVGLSLGFEPSAPLGRPARPSGWDGAPAAPVGLSAEPPGWNGEQRGEPGIHGIPRLRRWDVVETAVAPGLVGDDIAFSVLPDGTVIVDGDEPDGTMAPLADAVEAALSPPYRAEAVRRGRDTWSVGARSIKVIEQRGLDGDEAELVCNGGERTLTCDGSARAARAEAFTAAGERLGADYVVRATRLDGDLWEVEATPL